MCDARFLNSKSLVRISSFSALQQAMLEFSISARLDALRDEIRLICNQELYYRSRAPHSRQEIAAHARRELRLLEIEAELEKLQGQKIFG